MLLEYNILGDNLQWNTLKYSVNSGDNIHPPKSFMRVYATRILRTFIKRWYNDYERATSLDQGRILDFSSAFINNSPVIVQLIEIREAKKYKLKVN